MSRSLRAQRNSISLDVKLNNQNTKKLSAALHLLNKVGKDVVLEVEEDSLVLRSLNDSKSAFVSATLNKFFFEEFNAGAVNFSCKVAVKVSSVTHWRMSFSSPSLNEHTICSQYAPS